MGRKGGSVIDVDVRKPDSPMVFEENRIREVEEEGEGEDYSKMDPPNIVKRLNYDENEIVREGGVHMPNN